jgi:uncharacterized protein (TIGR02145 family)
MKARLWLPFLLFAISACDPKDHGTTAPVASFKIIPGQGATTDTFRFDAVSTVGGGRSKVYYRWDWNNDGIWDNEYTQIPVTNHRFYQPGQYRPLIGIINSEGLTDTLSVPVMIVQGFSPPHPYFTITPDTGNIRTRFVFDASGTRDDEDSLHQLRFLWDYTNSGSWDGPISSNPFAHHIFQDTGKFEVVLEAIDPGNLRRKLTKTVWVTNINTRLIADFKWTPDYGTTTTKFTLDASASQNPDTPQAVFRYSWKLPPDYTWTEWTDKPDTTIYFQREAEYDLELRVKDTASLINYCKKTITIYHQNLPPDPKFIIGCRRGNTRTQFFFNSWPTLDQESLPTTLEVRWDFDGDERWDTEFSKDRSNYHSYPEPGTYKVYLEARDPEGLSDTTAQFVEVTKWTNETGLIFDQRDGQYYGTVKIGTQWWMSQNLNFVPYDYNKDQVRKWCYMRWDYDPVDWCDIMGGLYNCYHATREDWYGEVRGICPAGWHMPSRKEWEILINNIGGWDQAERLLPGGNTDFNALYAGFAELKLDTRGIEFMSYQWLNYATYFWSFNKMSDPNAPNAWSLTLISGEKKFFPGWSSMNSFYSVRCVKNEQ